jgi:hypothetical protein
MMEKAKGALLPKGLKPLVVFGCALVLLLLPGGGPIAAHGADSAVRTFVGAVEGSDRAARLLAGLVESLAPERLDLVLEGGPDERGAVRRLYLDAEGVRGAAVRIDRIRLEAVFVRFDFEASRESATWGGLNVTEAMQGYFEGTVTEQDLNDFLLGVTLSGGGAQWRDLRLDLKPQGFRASARFSSGAVSAFVEIASDLKIVDRDRLVMSDYRVSVNHSETTMADIREAIEEAQPLLDFRTFPFPVRLRQLQIDEDTLVLSTSQAPTRFEGVTLRYEAR